MPIISLYAIFFYISYTLPITIMYTVRMYVCAHLNTHNELIIIMHVL